MKRIVAIFRENGWWSPYFICRLLANRLNVSLIRWSLRSPDIYFQGTPRIIGRRYIEFGRNFQCGQGAWFEALAPSHSNGAPEILLTFGDNITVSENLHVAAALSVSIGDNVLIGSGVLITDHSHGRYGKHDADSPATPPNRRALNVKGPVRIGNNVWIGDAVKILSGVTIGDGAVIAAASVVREDVAAATIYGQQQAGQVIRVHVPRLGGWHAPESSK